jgi:uncharacterized protein YjiS (DUF1127 family)
MSLIPSNLTAGPGRSLAAIGLDPTTPTLRRTDYGAIDFDHYLRRSQHLRAEFYAAALRSVGKAIGAVFAHLGKSWRNWQARRRAIDELMTMDDRSLRDLGINRAGVFYVVDHGREDVPAPANVNEHSKAA